LQCLKWSKHRAHRGLRGKLLWASVATTVLATCIGVSMNADFSSLIFSGADGDAPRQNAAQKPRENSASGQPASVFQDWDAVGSDLQQWSEDWQRFEQRQSPFWRTE
ncbi:MAG: hypothetical protein ACTHK7_04110, partial [Aureliella sp.]